MRILEILNELANTSGRNDKIAILKRHKDNQLFRDVVYATLDPGTQYYIKKIPGYAPEEFGPIPLEWAVNELKRFSSRELTGNAAIKQLSYILSHQAEDNAEVVERIISRDLKCGVNVGAINAAWPGFIDEFPYMRCSLPKQVKLDAWDWKGGVYADIKADGMFVNINNYDGIRVKLFSRNGTVLPEESFSYLIQDVKAHLKAGTQTHGELLVKKDGKVLPREVGNGILTSVIKGGSFGKGEYPILQVWDQINLTNTVAKGKQATSYCKRRIELGIQVQESFTIDLIESKIVYSFEEALEYYKEVVSRGGEGLILKKMSGTWKDGTSKDQVKLKLEVDVDLKIVGFTEGKGKNKDTFGSITCETSDGLLCVNVSGFKDKKQRGIMTRQEIWEKRDELLGTILAVRFNNIMPPTKSNDKYSLFLPRAVEFRPISDKSVADSLKRVQEQFDNAIKN